MNWKKNVFSYFMWMVYTAAAVGALIYMTATLMGESDYSIPLFGILCSGVLIFMGVIVFTLYRIRKGHFRGGSADQVTICVFEGLAVIGLVAVGVFLNSLQIPQSIGGEKYFEMAMVSEGQSLPQVVHGALYLYLNFLHLICMVFGNKILACLWAQIILHAIMGIVLYIAVRSIAGTLPAVVMLAFLTFSDYMRGETLMLSPVILYLLCYGMALCMVAYFLKRGNDHPILGLFSGIAIALVAYLDVIGLSLFLFVCSILMLEREKSEEQTASRKGLALFFSFLGFVIGFIFSIAMDAYYSAKTMWNVLNAWWELYRPEGFQVPMLVPVSEGKLDILLVAMLALGIFSFWLRRKQEKLSVWVLVATALGTAQCFRMTTDEISVFSSIYFIAAVLAGIALSDIFGGSLEKTEADTEEAPGDEKKEETVLQEVSQDTENLHKLGSEEDISETEGSEEIFEPCFEKEKELDEGAWSSNEFQRVITLLDNPMPPRQRPRRKPADYDFSYPDDTGYDFPVDQSDDFDI